MGGRGSFGDAEAPFGEVMREAPQLRERFVLATKGGMSSAYPMTQAQSISSGL